MGRYVFKTLLVGGIYFSTRLLMAQVLFEGYYKIQAQDEHIGYSVQRYESLQEAQKFKATIFIKTNAQGGSVTESIVTESDAQMRPLKMVYTGIVGKQVKTIDALIDGGELIAEIRDGSKTEKKKIKLEPGIFFSGILIYSILKSPQGLSPETQYNYKSIAEENLQIVSGKAIIKGFEDFRGKIKALKVLNEFNNQKFYSWVTERGEVLETLAPYHGVTTYLVPNSEEALKGQVVPQKTLQALFGDIPKGHENMAYRAHLKGEWPSAPGVGVQKGQKSQFVPPGKGIHTK